MNGSSELWPELAAERARYRSFSQHGWVMEERGQKAVFIGGQLIGSFDPKDAVARNLLLVTASQDPRVRLGRLARAFGVGGELLRRVRRRHEKGGVKSLLQVGRPGRKTVRTKNVTDALTRMFDAGASINQALAQYQGRGKRGKSKGGKLISRATVGRVYQQWKQRQLEQRLPTVCTGTPRQLTLPIRQESKEEPSAELEQRAAVSSEPTENGGGEETKVLRHKPLSLQTEGAAVGAVVVDGILGDHQLAASAGMCRDLAEATAKETAGQKEAQTDRAESQDTSAGAVSNTAEVATVAEGPAAVADEQPVLGESQGEQETGGLEGTQTDRAESQDTSAGAASNTAEVATVDATEANEQLVLSEPQGELDWGQIGVENGQLVQHVGSWVALALLNAWGLYRHLEHLRVAVAGQGKKMVGAAILRLAIDMTAVSLCIGEHCIEGVRRIATLSAPVLLRSDWVPSAPWVRHVINLFVRDNNNAEKLHFLTAHQLIERAVLSAKLRCPKGSRVRVAFYLDNHMRPYTGQHNLRKGWRMQDKRARRGVTDYWVHDEDGRAVLRVTSPSHEPLTKVLAQVANLLRTVVGKGIDVMLVFDRAGAHPRMLQELRNAKYDFATYERRPYSKLSPSEFVYKFRWRNETIHYVEKHHKNLRRGRGRVRRVSLLMPDQEQVNILCISRAPAQEIIGTMLSRWGRQENQFKHGVERWGINHLDGRRVAPYPPDAIIPNPERSRLERALRVARADEADALRKLSRLPRNHPDREQLKARISEARASEKELLAQRPTIPKKAPVRETSLSHTLVAHQVPYKLLVDTVRVLLANVESDLAVKLGPHLSRPAEAKKALSNLLRAPGRVRINARSIRVQLMPSGSPSEQRAFDAFLSDLNRYHFTLPGDQSGRRLVFQTLSE
jgi:hypothetical protein